MFFHTYVTENFFNIRQLALTAASPFYRGYISDVDCRWSVISSSVDCRTQEERGLKPLKENKFKISKSRYDSIDSYLSRQGEKYNDVPLTYDDEIYKQLLENGIDHLLAQHIAHLFIRDSVSLFSEKVHQNDLEDTDHFEVRLQLNRIFQKLHKSIFVFEIKIIKNLESDREDRHIIPLKRSTLASSPLDQIYIHVRSSNLC